MAGSHVWAGVVSVLLVLVLFTSAVDAIYFQISDTANGGRCFMEVVPESTRVLATYENPNWRPWGSKDFTGVGVRATVMDPHGMTVLEKVLDQKGRFALETFHGGEYKVCLSTNSTSHRFPIQKFKVDLKLDIGEMAIDYNEVAKKEHLDSLAVEVRKLNDKLKDIMNQQAFQRNRELTVREQSEETNQQVQWWSFLQIVVLGVSAAWQLVHLKSFVMQKKLA